MASKIVKNLNSCTAEVFLNPDWMNLVLADLVYIGLVILVLTEFRALWIIYKLYQANKLISFWSNIIKLINKIQICTQIKFY